MTDQIAEDKVTLFKKNLRDKGFTEYLIPIQLDEFAKTCSYVVCNKISEGYMTALANNDQLTILAERTLGGGVDSLVENFFRKDLQKGEHMLVHHTKDEMRYTCLVKLSYEYKGTVVFDDTPKRVLKKYGSTIELVNIIAVAKVPANKKIEKISEKHIQDPDSSIFIRIARKLFF